MPKLDLLHQVTRQDDGNGERRLMWTCDPTNAITVSPETLLFSLRIAVESEYVPQQPGVDEQ
jgi:hypothetical protein